MKISIYDATLREGAQSPDISFTLQDKMRIAQIMDALDVDYIEAGNPGSNPKDAEFYREMARQPLKNAKLVAFGATCRVGMKPGDDANVQALLASGAQAICIFGKAWDFHVDKVLHATLEQNLEIIRNTVDYFKQHGVEVIFDAEHYFDGFKNNAEYAMNVLREASKAGADWLCLCDTNGGCFAFEVEEIVAKARHEYPHTPIGVHMHNDTGMAAANTVAGVRAGACMAQVTANGWGERCGNADIFTVVPDMQLKLGYDCLPAERLSNWTQTARQLYEIANMRTNRRAPYVGNYAFSHKAGMHIDAISKEARSFEHIPPEMVGAERKILLSEVAGRVAVMHKIKSIVPESFKDSENMRLLLEKLKQMEFEGYQFEGADASFELLVKRQLKLYRPFFELRSFKVIVSEPALDGDAASAMVTIRVGGEDEIAAATGNGPVNALDVAARKALERFFPVVGEMYLSDFKVRVLDSKNTTASKVRVLVESTDGRDRWTTIGVSTDIINASWMALWDSLEYKLLKQVA